MVRAETTIKVNHDVSSELGDEPGFYGVHETNHGHTLTIEILERPEDDYFWITVGTNVTQIEQELGDHAEGLLPVTVDTLRAAVQSCRNEWHQAVVANTFDADYPAFQIHWDLSQRPALLDLVLARITEAGRALFLAIFGGRGYNGPEEDLAPLRTIRDVLRRHMDGSEGWIKVTSSTFYAPWNLIYSRDPKLPPDPSGFWGYHHDIDHVPFGSGSPSNELKSTLPLEVGVQADETLDKELEVACLKPILDWLDQLPGTELHAVQRNRKEILRKAVISGVTDSVMLFVCHGEQEGDLDAIVNRQGRIILSDLPRDVQASQITPNDLSLWYDTEPEPLANHPVVFLNACGLGQFNSTFYMGFASMFLEGRACSVIGPQTDIPAVFAGEFARRFLEQFTRGGPDNKIGSVLRNLRAEFIDSYNNPLGLLYSSYRGSEAFLEPRHPPNP